MWNSLPDDWCQYLENVFTASMAIWIDTAKIANTTRIGIVIKRTANDADLSTVMEYCLVVMLYV